MNLFDNLFKDEEEETTQERPSSLLVINCGQTIITVLLVKSIGEGYRIIARQQVPTRVSGEAENLLSRVLEGIKGLEAASGHVILTDENEIIRNTLQIGRGIDQVGLTFSVSDPLKIVLVAPSVDDMAVSSADYLIQSFPSVLLRVITPDSIREMSEELKYFLANRPDAILFVGTESSKSKQVVERMSDMARIIGLALRQFSIQKRPQVIYAASGYWIEDISQALTEEVKLHQVSNLRPDALHENLKHSRIILHDLIRDVKLNRLTGVPQLMRWSNVIATSTLTNMLRFTRFQAQMTDEPIMLINWDQHALTMIYGLSQFSNVVVRPEFGLGQALGEIHSHIDLEELYEWLPWHVSKEDGVELIKNYLAHKSILPETMPLNQEEAQIFQALIQLCLREALKDAKKRWGLHDRSPFKLGQIFVGGEQLVNFLTPSGIILSLLNGLQTIGSSEVFVDQHLILPAIGALLDISSEVVIDLPIRDALLELGWIIGISGKGLFSRSVATVKIEDLGVEAAEEIDPQTVNWNALTHLQVGVGKQTDVTVQTHLGVGLGSGVSGNKKFEKVFGETHFVIDTRPRPINLPNKQEDRIATLQRWYAELDDPYKV